MKALIKIISLGLVLLVCARSASLFVVCTPTDLLYGSNKKSETYLTHNDNPAIAYTDRVKIIDSCQFLDNKYRNWSPEIIKQLISCTYSIVQCTQHCTYVSKTENTAIFKEHFIPLQFHSFY